MSDERKKIYIGNKAGEDMAGENRPLKVIAGMNDERKVKIKKITVRRPTIRELRKKSIPLEETFNAEHQIVDVEFEESQNER